MPPIVLPFYWYVYEKDNVPPPETLVKNYLTQDNFKELPNNKIEVDYKNKISTLNKKSIVARVLRAYPSLVRDLHFYLLAKECGYFQEVKYSFIEDFEDGIDIKVKYKNKWHNVALMQNTARSLNYYAIKKTRRHPQLKIIDIPIDIHACDKCGDYYLYTKSHIHTLLTEINKKNK